jgi:hypothetical protein
MSGPLWFVYTLEENSVEGGIKGIVVDSRMMDMQSA